VIARLHVFGMADMMDEVYSLVENF
jgi:hypothetical protein